MYELNQGTQNTLWNAAQDAWQAEQERLRPFMQLRPRMFQDGNQWCAMYGGDNIMESVCAFGDCPDAAARAFDETWRTGAAAA